MADGDIGTVTELAKKVEGKLWGKFRGTVTSNKDPEKRGRLKLKVASVFASEETDWVPGVFALGGNGDEAMVAVPAEKSQVLVEFIEGDRSAPVWTGTIWDKKTGGTQIHADFDLPQGELHLLRTRKGITMRLEDNGEDEGQVFILRHPSGAEVSIDKKGILVLKDADNDGAEVTLDPSAKSLTLKGHDGQEVQMASSKLTLKVESSSITIDGTGITLAASQIKLDGDSVLLGKGAASPVLNAKLFSSFFDAHAHAGIGSPPAPSLATLLATLTLSKVKGA